MTSSREGSAGRSGKRDQPPAAPPIRGRGASENPANRFERLHVVPDRSPAAGPWDDEDPAPATQFLRDSSSSVVATNESPDVGFDASVNPYRGCEHGCVYCAWGETPILMGDGTTSALADLQVGDEIYGTVRQGWCRRYVKTRVLAHWETKKLAYRITLEDGTELIASGDHRFLASRGWKFVTGSEQGRARRPHLTTNDELMGIGGFPVKVPRSVEYQVGYLCGIIRGDGHLGSHSYSRFDGRRETIHQFRLALIDETGVNRAAAYLEHCGIQTTRFPFKNANGRTKELSGIRVQRRRDVDRIRQLVAWPSAASPDWSMGFLAGIFDAEGSYSGGILRISNTEEAIIQTMAHSMQRLGFDVAREHVTRHRVKPVTVIRLRGGLKEHLRFFHTVDPAILRKRNIESQALKSDAKLRVVSLEPIGRRTLFDVTTGTGDFIANGVVSHNCYARPTHEYLGFSAGLDFETKILVKEDAPELLRRELSSPRWTPRLVALSGVTDPYQPVERRLGLTRRCLEVLAEFRNPVMIITKNYRVTRDLDLLAELARVEAAAVFLSITTLDPALVRVMEPRTSTPARRLAAIEAAVAAGVPAGVMVAPVIPGLTDHELPAIVEAAARAGARFAGFTMLRLPYGVGPLFEAWLGQHFPARKEKVLNRIRAIRGGKLNDPRFASRMRGEGIFAEQAAALFAAACRRAGIPGRGPELSTAAFRKPDGPQLALFEEARV
jgi:DNA repair photolyase